MSELNEKKKRAISITAAIGIVAAVIAILANLAQVLDFLGIKPKNMTDTPIAEQTVPASAGTIPESTSPTSSETKMKETEPEKPKPVKLSSLSFFNSSQENGAWKTVGSQNDNTGNSHSQALVNKYNMYRRGEKNDYNEYLLDGAYSKLLGSIFVTEEEKAYQHDVIVEIYCDDELKQSYTLKGGSLPEEMDIDVSSCKVLQVRFYGREKDLGRSVVYIGDSPDFAAEGVVGLDATLYPAE